MVLSAGEAEREVRVGVISGSAALRPPPARPSHPREWGGGCQRKWGDQVSALWFPPAYHKNQDPASSSLLLLLSTSALLPPSLIPRPACPNGGGSSLSPPFLGPQSPHLADALPLPARGVPGTPRSWSVSPPKPHGLPCPSPLRARGLPGSPRSWLLLLPLSSQASRPSLPLSPPGSWSPWVP